MSIREKHRLEFLAYHAFACIAKVELVATHATKEDAAQANEAIRENLERALVAVATFSTECGRIFKERTGVDMANPRDAEDVVSEIMARDA